MASNKRRPGDPRAADIPPGPCFVPTREPWGDWYRQLYPRFEHPKPGFSAWKCASVAVNITEVLWNARERARHIWEADAENGENRHLGHPATGPALRGIGLATAKAILT